MNAFINRRQLLQQSGVGFGALALQGLLSREPLSAADANQSGEVSSLAARLPQFAPHAKAVIFLFMYGGPSHVDLFDPKPALARMHGQPIPVWKNEDAFMGAKTKNVAMASPLSFYSTWRIGN